MSLVQSVLGAMREGCIYRPCDIAAQLHIDTGEAGKLLRMLERGGMVEVIRDNGYRRKRMYKTKQRALPI